MKKTTKTENEINSLETAEKVITTLSNLFKEINQLKAENEALKNADKAKKETSTECLTVTSVQVYPIKELQSKTRAFARIVLNDQMQMTGLRVVDGTMGLFVSYPNDPSYKGDDYRSLFYPLTKELREHIEAEVLKVYHQMPKD